MKKLFSFLTGIAIASAVMNPLTSFADSEAGKPVPLLYFRSEENDAVNIISDSVVQIDRKNFHNGDITLKIGAYIKDDTKELCAFSAKWRCESEYISIGNILNPKDSTGESKEYITSAGEKFSTDMTPFPFAVISDGVMEITGSPEIVMESDINSAAFSYAPQKNVMGRAFSYLGQTSDEYAFTYFDAVIDADTPAGDYEIIFATQDNTIHEEGDSREYSHGLSVDLETDVVYVIHPEIQSLKLIVNDGNLIGDADLDGVVDSSDASLVLKEYANAATGNEISLSDYQQFLADADKSGAFDSYDSSLILSYYAFISTGGNGSLEEFIKS